MATMGRPKKAEGALVPITVKVPAALKEILSAMAEEDARTLAQMARFALEEGTAVIKATGLKNLNTKGRRRRTRRIKGDRIIRANASRRGSVERFTSQRLLGSRAEREGFDVEDDGPVAGDPRPAA